MNTYILHSYHTHIHTHTRSSLWELYHNKTDLRDKHTVIKINELYTTNHNRLSTNVHRYLLFMWADPSSVQMQYSRLLTSGRSGQPLTSASSLCNVNTVHIGRLWIHRLYPSEDVVLAAHEGVVFVVQVDQIPRRRLNLKLSGMRWTLKILRPFSGGEGGETNISGWKRRAIHIGDTDEDI